jgi:Zn-dependent protease with chaperone function
MDQKKDASSIAWAAFFVVFGIWLISVAFVGLPLAFLIASFLNGEDASSRDAWIILAFIVAPWTLAGPLFLTGFADRHWWQKRNGCREMDELERARLVPLWNEVCLRAGLSPDAYRLVMTSQSTVNAFATGDSMVSIDQGMLGSLGDPEIKAIIAHELGHHTKRHIGAIVLEWWYARPAEILLNLMFALTAILIAVGRQGCGCVGILVLAGLLVFLLGPALVLFLLLGGTILLMRIIGRRTEFEADSYAQELGMGREMSSALALLRQAYPEADPENETFIDRLTRTHPTLDDRIAQLAEAS